VGYELLGEGRTDDALAVFELNVEMHPHAYNPWDSLGEALAGAGHTAEAIEAYQRSVELNRASRSGQAALRRLRRLRREASNGISGSE
jgi:cytochrome c-type biogenesis protein CcmH/NrfG